MVFVLVAAVLLLVIASLTWVLARRDRRRTSLSGEGLRIEAAAHRDWREAQRLARAGRRLNAASTSFYLPQRRR